MGLPSALIVLVLMAPAPLLAANAPGSSQAPQPPRTLQDDELDEVFVEGRRNRDRPRSWDDYQQPFNFLARLVGQYVVAGQVDLHAQGKTEDLRTVSGRATCLGFGAAPGVQCELNLQWPETRGPGGE